MVLVTASLMLWRTNLLSNNLAAAVGKAATQLEGDRARTRFGMTAASADRSNNTLAATLTNFGATSVSRAAFDKIDIIVIYDGGAKDPLSLTYKESIPLAPGEWTQTFISGNFEPFVFNPKETMTISASLVGSSCDNGTLVIALPNGITDTRPYVCSPLDLFFHSEATGIAATNYYQLKDDIPADGAAATISTVFSAGQTGRVRPTSLNGKFVYPLNNVPEVPAANWDMTYRVKRDKANMGFVWFTDAQDISLPTLAAGTHDGPLDQADLTDSTADFVAAGVAVGDYIENLTDGSSAAITSFTATSVTATLSGGAENLWDTGDSYVISRTNGWYDINLSSNLPVGATGAIVEVVNTTTNSYSGVVRATEDARDYMSNPSYEEIEAESHRWQMVKVDSNRRIQGYIENTGIDFKLLGYTVGPDPAFIIADGVTPDITPGITGAWTPVTVSGHVDDDADGVILLIDSLDASDQRYALREAGSSETITDRELEQYSNTMYLVGLNSWHQFEAWIGDPEVKIYLVGQTKGSVVYFSLDIPVADPSTGSWQELNATSFGVPASADGLVLHAVNSSGQGNIYEIGFRHADSSDDWSPGRDLGGSAHFQAAIGLRESDNNWDEYMQHQNVDVYIAAFTRLIFTDAHADVDVLIRRDDGTIRTTLATDVANTSNITSTDWTTSTVTLAFPGYTVVDGTDYLEIDLFAEATTNSSGESVSVDFRIDDPVLPLADQMRAREIVP